MLKGKRKKDPRTVAEKTMKFEGLKLCAELAAMREAKRPRSKALYGRNARKIVCRLLQLLELCIAAAEAECDPVELDADLDVDTRCPSAAFQLTFGGER